ncbi:MAG: hypothetical protein ACJ763_08835 [Bdellovibrionia bacterium]
MKLLNPYLDLFRILESESEALQLSARKKLIWAYSWAIPNDEAIAALKEFSPLLELGAGTGYWAWLLRQSGADILACDRNSVAPPHWTAVEPGDEKVVSRHSHRSLFLCWPSYQEPLAFEALQAYSGQRVAYVGELNGRTADDAFHRLLSEEYKLQREVIIPVWPGYRDRLYFFQKKS